MTQPSRFDCYLKMIALLALALSLVACRGSQRAESAPTVSAVSAGRVSVIEVTPTLNPFDSTKSLNQIVADVIAPWHVVLAAEARSLHSAAVQFEAEPSKETLSDVQAQWRSTAAAWARMEVLDFRASMVLRNQIKKWPANIELLEELIRSDETIDDGFVAAQGSHVKGLATIEYLLFSPGIASDVETSDAEAGDIETSDELLNLLVDQPNRVAYLVGAAAALTTSAEELQALWDLEGEVVEQFVSSSLPHGSIDGTFDQLLNAVIFHLEWVERTKMGFPLRGTDAYAKPDAVESPYATYSFALIEQNLLGIRDLLGAGLEDYLLSRQSYYDSSVLIRKADEQYAATLSALQGMDVPLSQAVLENPRAVASVWEEIKELSRRFEVDMANHVGLVVTIGQNDGD